MKKGISMKKLILCLFMIGILFSASFAVAYTVNVSPSSFTLNIIAGDTIQKEINIQYTGESSLIGFLTTTITPDGEGINITYTNDEGRIISLFNKTAVILPPNRVINVTMTIDTDTMLVPGTYYITTNFTAETDEIIQYIPQTNGHTGGTETIYVEDTTRITELIALINSLEDRLDEMTQDSNANQQTIDDLNDIIDNLRSEIDRLSNQAQPSSEDEYGKLALFVGIGILIMLIVLFLYFIVKHGRTKKK